MLQQGFTEGGGVGPVGTFVVGLITFIARSAYYVPLAHQEPASVRAARARRAARGLRPAKSGNVSKMDRLKRI